MHKPLYKFWLITICMLFTVVVGSTISNATELTPMIQIVIDPGHGGIDSGAAYDNVHESMINLAVSKHLQNELSTRGFHTILTRERDEALSDSSRRKDIGSRHQRDLTQRTEITKHFAPHVMISIHSNSGSSTKTGGQVLYQKDGRSYNLALILQKHLNQLTNTRERPLVGKNFFILNHAKTIAVIVEIGFISNPSERALLQTEVYQQKLANTIANGLEEYISIMPW